MGPAALEQLALDVARQRKGGTRWLHSSFFTSSGVSPARAPAPIGGLPAITAIRRAVPTSTRIPPTPAATTPFTIRVTSLCLNMQGARAIVYTLFRPHHR